MSNPQKGRFKRVWENKIEEIHFDKESWLALYSATLTDFHMVNVQKLKDVR